MNYNLLNRYGSWSLVTGGSSGIGLELTRIFTSEGINVVLVARNQVKL